MRRNAGEEISVKGSGRSSERMSERVGRIVNGKWMAVERRATVYEAARQGGNWGGETQSRNRPHYCYKEGRRGVSATCRMCRVEREGGRKPVPSCARPVGRRIGVYTDTPYVRKVREGVMERRLRNHPLDCPICDQGGECDLQDQSRERGGDSTRVIVAKRGVEDKRRLGGRVSRVITRCIHCTRCVRYSKQVAGVGSRGRTGRGQKAEIGMYVGKDRGISMSGNRTERCPVGARTRKGVDAQYGERPWEKDWKMGRNVRDGQGEQRKRYRQRKGTMQVSSREGMGTPNGYGKGGRGDKIRGGRDGRCVIRRRESYVGTPGDRDVARRRSTVQGGKRWLEIEGYVREGEGRSISHLAVRPDLRVEKTQWLRGGGVDREMAEVRREMERAGQEGLVEARGLGKRVEARRMMAERVKGGTEGGPEGRKEREVGVDRTTERPLMGGNTEGLGRGYAYSAGKGQRGGGRHSRVSLAEGLEKGRVERVGEIRRVGGAGVWERADGREGRKRRKLRGDKGGKVNDGLERRHHKTNTVGRALVGRPVSGNRRNG